MSNTNELKEVTVGGKEFSLVKLDPWKRLTFIADFQREFLAPALKKLSEDNKEFKDVFSEGNLDVMSLISSLSSLIDGARLEHWTKRILAEGLIIHTREDGKRAKLSFGELNTIFNSPTDIILLLKDVIMYNMDDVGGLIASFAPVQEKAKVTIAEKKAEKKTDNK